MSFSVNVPPSMVAKMSKNAEEDGGDVDEEKKEKKREDWRKLKELEEARKAGTAPAMQDEEGKDINPHIPQYIMQAPWYFGAMQPTLNHQRVQPDTVKEFSSMDNWYKKGVKEGPAATKFKKGACENCGATTHKKKDCLERPRKLGARFTGQDIAPDEYLQPNLDFDFEGKRDRWNGYDVQQHKEIVAEYQKMEEAKRQLKAATLEQEMSKEDAEKALRELERKERLEEDEDDADDKYADDMDMPGQKFETKQRITVRNLRIREDTAKYLYNLDVNSAYYDPKTRSMRENPFKPTGKGATDIPYAGDNFVRTSGDSHEMAKKQLFAWDAYEKGADVHLQADPTKLEVLAREYKSKKEAFKTDVKGSILAKYGGEEHLEAPPKQLLLAQTEDYVEYSRQGTIIKGQEKARAKSRYEEDVYINNHMSVWGSYWKEGQWGYRCCHSFLKESYCTGAAGQQAEQTSIPGMEPKEEETAVVATATVSSPPKPTKLPANPLEQLDKEEIEEIMKQYEERLKEAKKKRKKKEKKNKKKRAKRSKKKKDDSSSSDSSSESEDEEEAREKRIQEAMKKMDEKEKEVDRIMQMDERKRPYNVMYELKAPTEEEMEAFRRKRQRDEDPMTQFADLGQ